MAKEKNAVVAPFFRELTQLGVYKRNQGRIARQVTFATLAIVFSLAAWRMFHTLPAWHGQTIGGDADSTDRTLRFAACGALWLVGLWVSYRLVNVPSFADFLIAVEAEMNKVSWPTRIELVRSCIVVIFSILFLTGILFGYDVFWGALLKYIGVIHG